MQSNASGWLIVPNSFVGCSHFQLYRNKHANYRSPLICSLQAKLSTLTLLQPSKVLHWYNLNSLVVILAMVQNTGREESHAQLLDVWYHPLARAAVKNWSG